MKKFIKRIHLWLSIPAGIVIFLMCITGATLVFQNEIQQLLNREHYRVKERASEPIPLDELIATVNSNLSNDTISGIQIFSNPGRTYVATLTGRTQVYVDPYTAEVKGYGTRSKFFSGVTRMHRWLMFKNSRLGRLITGISTICFVVILISGIVAWWPRKNAFKKVFFIMELKKGGTRRLFDLHRVLGLYAAVFLLLMALTGLMWSFQWYRSGIAAIFGIEKNTQGRTEHGGSKGSASGRQGLASDREKMSNAIWWQDALDAVRTEVRDNKYVRISSNGSVTVFPADAPHPRGTDSYRYVHSEKRLETVSRYGDKKDNGYMMIWAYSLHAGTWGGIFVKILYFLAALAGASLPVTGYWLWFKKHKKKRRPAKG